MESLAQKTEKLNIESFLSHLRSLDIQLSIENGRLKLNAPKGAVTESLREDIKKHKAEIFRFHQRNASRLTGIPRLSRQEPIPCSFAQQRLWLMDKLEPNSCAYNIPVFLRALGELQIPALKAAVNEIIQRHESLRTVFCEPESVSSEPRQWILPNVIIDIPITDLSSLAENAAETKVQELAVSHMQAPFDLVQGPLLRLNILKVADQHHVLLFTVHHIVFDGLSLDIFLKELSALYGAFSQRLPSPLQDLDIHYADFSVWQRDRLTGKHLQEHLDFWRNELAGASPILGLPNDHPRPAVQSYAGARQVFEVNSNAAQKLRALSQQNDTTLFMTFHAVLAILLARYTNKDDIVIGVPVANRNHRQLEALIGFFANTIVLRSEVKSENSFNELLAQIKTRDLQAFKYQELPFEKLVSELTIERSMSHNPLFQVLYSFHNAPTAGFSLPGVDIQPLQFDYTASKFDLSFIVREHQDTFTVILEYSTALFEASTIERMIDHFRMLLETIVEQPKLAIGKLPMLTEQDARQLQTWNDTTIDYPKNQTLLVLFEAQVERTPNKIAVVFNNQQFSYQQLNAQANRLAHFLLQNTVCKNIRNPVVAISVERSPEMIIGLLGILKAGAAYLPIDPGYPVERISYMVIDSKAALVLTQHTLKDTLALNTVETGPQVLCLDEDIFAGYPTANPLLNSQPDELAYVIYTSGSTGKPKAVAVEQRNIMAMLAAYEHISPCSNSISSSSVCPFGFDVFAWECFSTLCFGHSLHVIPTEIVTMPDVLAEYLQQHNIGQAYLPPSILEAVLIHFEAQGYLPFQRLLVGVEPIKESLLQRFRDLSPSLSIINGYGPTEATICATFYDFKASQQPSRNTPIGRPLANYRIYLCNKNNQLVPISVSGEICIAGNGLARGYINSSALNSEKYISSKFFDKREFIYKTGDLARWLPDGNLEFLGRIDHQVKVRGFRIELGEIESILSQHPNVGKSVVITRETTLGDKKLVAYVQIEDKNTQAKLDFNLKKDIKNFLQEKLPAYMVPAFLVQLDSFPLLPNGKINRKALPEPERQNVQSKSYMHPRNSLELSLSQIWENILNLSPISVFDNFFEIGGDSLLAIRLISVINKKYDIRIPQHALFENGTIEQLTCLLRDNTTAKTAFSPLVGLQIQGDKTPIFCVHAAGGIVFRYLQIANLMSSKYSHPFYGLQARGIEPGEMPYASIEVMAQHYVQAIREVKPQGPYLLAGWSMGGSVAFEMARLLENTGETITGLIMIDTPSPYMDTYEEDDIEFLLERLQPAIGLKLQDELHKQTSDKAKKLYILEQKKLLGLFAPDIELSEAEQRLRLHKHHNQLLCQYRPTSSITAKIAFIKAAEVTPFDKKMKDPVTAWAEFTHQGVIEYESLGNHFNMFSNEHSPILADKLHACIQNLGI